VDSRSLSAPLENAFLALLDDASPAVRAALLAEFSQRGPAALGFLQGIARGGNRLLAGHAAWFLRELNCSDPVVEFRSFIRSLNYELETGAWLLGRTLSPDLDVGACCTLLDEIAMRCRALMVEPSSARERCRVLNRVLFHEYGFRGSLGGGADPLNSLLDQVLVRRQGLPITLSMLYVLVGQRVGLTLEPVALPDHFLVGCFLEDPPFFVDAFEQGVVRTRADLFQQLRSKDFEPKASDLAPTPVREVLCECCRNLARNYAAAGEHAHARRFAGFVEEFEAAYGRPAAG
jgi:regulator of sirC expression with transglutaminase-like and TPR domain